MVCIVLGVGGVGLLLLARSAPTWAALLPLSELGGVLFGAGVLGIGLDGYLKRENDELAERRLRQVLADNTPALRDAVIEGFAFQPDDLKRVATPELLDQVLRNSLALRLGDATFAGELYDDLRDQAIRAAERWQDVRVDIRLSMLSSAASGRTGLYVATIRWEYAVVPAFPVRRFVAVADRDEYRELAQESAATSAWYIRPKGNLAAGEREAFELVQFSVNGQARPIRRTARKDGQTYTVSLGEDVVRAARPVTVAYTYRTVVSRDGHLLHIDVEQPTRGISVELDYSATDIAYVKVVDFIASSRKSRLIETPEGIPGRVIGVQFDGWLMPRAGVAFVWVLHDSSAT
ncbi:hypothetical protein GCM10023225_09720 [Kineococcus glutinatus]|uniref:Uncharacterized protein n=1 Tax=Kineococcus glutinatus TaxID=1070872 RepID=A0ABP9HFE8_9ACTN